MGIEKSPTGIEGLDQLTSGGLPAGRPTLICGGPGCGKTLMAMTFLVNGAVSYGENGVFVSFEERRDDLVKNVASLGYDLDQLIEDRVIALDHVRVERSEIEETGEYDLEGLFIRLGYAIDSVGAKRIVLDTIETLFGGLSNTAILRAELRRLLEWLKDRGITAIITGERGDGQLTRHGLEEYVSDCVILLDHRVQNQVSTRRLRVVKYRGSSHGTNEYPFLIDDRGLSVMPITSAGLNHGVSEERIPTGVAGLDDMLGGRGYYRGSSILVSGMAGSGKSSLAAHFADAVCRAGERCLYFAFEESPRQIVRNMRSIGLDLQPWLSRDLLRFSANRPTVYGLEMHLVQMHRLIEQFNPSAVIIDPISSLMESGVGNEIQMMLLRLIDHMKSRQITSVFTNLTHGNIELAKTDTNVSSLMDTWILLYNRASNGEHNREVYVLKSRGMEHSNQVREFVLSREGIELREAYVGPEGVVTGSARLAQEAREHAESKRRRQEAERRSVEIERKKAQLQAQIVALQAELAAEEEERHRLSAQASEAESRIEEDRDRMRHFRSGSGRVRRD
ncbi:MAG: kaiC [Rhodospirillales bacterium]|nr:kaiC [Rhodospirillales bacterium]